MAEQTAKPGSPAVIKFDMAVDEAIRVLSRKGHEIAKNMKSAGIQFKRIIPAASDLSIRKQFRLGQNSAHICIEVPYGTDQMTNDLLINDVKTQLMSFSEYKLISEQKYVYDASEQVYRFLLLGDVTFKLPVRDTEEKKTNE